MRAQVFFFAALLLAGGAPAAAEEVGTVADRNPQVLAYPPGKPSRELSKNDPVERGLKVRLEGEHPYLKVALYFGRGVEIFEGGIGRITGVASVHGKGEIDFGDPATPSELKIRITPGEGRGERLKLWLSLLPLSPVPLVVESLEALMAAKGTRFRVLANSAFGTFLAVDEGVVEVQAKAGGEPVQVTAGHWVLVPPGGLPTRPAPLPPGEDDEIPEDPPLLGCCPGTEPPKPPQ